MLFVAGFEHIPATSLTQLESILKELDGKKAGWASTNCKARAKLLRASLDTCTKVLSTWRYPVNLYGLDKLLLVMDRPWKPNPKINDGMKGQFSWGSINMDWLEKHFPSQLETSDIWVGVNRQVCLLPRLFRRLQLWLFRRRDRMAQARQTKCELPMALQSYFCSYLLCCVDAYVKKIQPVGYFSL